MWNANSFVQIWTRVAVSIAYDSNHLITNASIRIRIENIYKNVVSNIEQVLAATPHKAPAIRTPASHHENYPS